MRPARWAGWAGWAGAGHWPTGKNSGGFGRDLCIVFGIELLSFITIFSPNGVPNAGCEAALQPATMQGISPDTRNEAAHVQSNPQPNAWLWNTLYSESGPAPGHHARVARAPHMRPGAAAAPRAGPQVSGPAAAHPAGRAPAGVASGPDSSGRRPRAPARRLPGAPAVSARARRRRTGARPGREGRRYYSVHLGSRP